MKLLEGEGLTVRVPGLGWRVAGQGADDPRAYVRVTTGARKRLASGEWKPGDPLPAIGSLAEEFGCGRLRVTTGLKPLEAEGLIVRGPDNRWWVRSGEDPRLHMRIAARLREGIGNGEFKPGENLPSTVSLAAQYGCRRQTVGRALKPLRAEGLIVFRAGLGYSVADPLPGTAVDRELKGDSS
jgi:DNA-binding GntR family transcriptional regulator